MTLSFPNQSRSYDEKWRRIRFWGHDNALEVPFLLEEAAIFKLFPKTATGESGILAAFDAGRERIVEVARAAYVPGERRSFYVLAAANF